MRTRRCGARSSKFLGCEYRLFVHDFLSRGILSFDVGGKEKREQPIIITLVPNQTSEPRACRVPDSLERLMYRTACSGFSSRRMGPSCFAIVVDLDLMFFFTKHDFGGLGREWEFCCTPDAVQLKKITRRYWHRGLRDDATHVTAKSAAKPSTTYHPFQVWLRDASGHSVSHVAL
ncbi:hypothetical protein VTO42DRAFT_950 [Malbranchea cinnamomea]